VLIDDVVAPPKPATPVAQPEPVRPIVEPTQMIDDLDSNAVQIIDYADDIIRQSPSAQMYHQALESENIWTGKSRYWLSRNTGAGDTYPWKMHIYADSYDDFALVSDNIIPYLVDNRVTFKTFASTREGVENVLDPSSSQFGKAFTIYVRDEVEFIKIANGLNQSMKRANLQKIGGSILGENRLDDTGRIFYRAERFQNEHGLHYISAKEAREIAPDNPYNPFNMPDPFKNMFL
jgi:hypothetical protein